MFRIVWAIALHLILFLPAYVQAATATYHLHKEASTTTGLDQLRRADFKLSNGLVPGGRSAPALSGEAMVAGLGAELGTVGEGILVFKSGVFGVLGSVHDNTFSGCNK
jgi:hypothetical protein